MAAPDAKAKLLDNVQPLKDLNYAVVKARKNIHGTTLEIEGSTTSFYQQTSHFLQGASKHLGATRAGIGGSCYNSSRKVTEDFTVREDLVSS